MACETLRCEMPLADPRRSRSTHQRPVSIFGWVDDRGRGSRYGTRRGRVQPPEWTPSGRNADGKHLVAAGAASPASPMVEPVLAPAAHNPPDSDAAAAADGS